MSRNGKSPAIEQRPSVWTGRASSNNNNDNNNDDNRRNIRLSISPDRSSTSSSSSPSSCVSSDSEEENSSPANSAMVLAGCPRCLMYVMLSGKEARCPRCNNALLLDFAKGATDAPSTSRKARRS